MASTQDFAEYVIDSVSLEKVKVRKMFGDFAFYFEEKVVGFICDNIFFLKITENSTKILQEENIELEQKSAYPGSRNFYVASEELLENRKFLQKIIFGIWQDVGNKTKNKKFEQSKKK